MISIATILRKVIIISTYYTIARGNLGTKDIWSKLFNVDISDYQSDYDFREMTRVFESHHISKEDATIYPETEYPFIIHIESECEHSSCHSKISESLPTTSRYTVIDFEYAQVISSPQNMKSLKTTFPFIKDYKLMTPAIKIDKEVLYLSRNCSSLQDAATPTEMISLTLSILPMTNDQLNRFQNILNKLSIFPSHQDKQQQSQSQAMLSVHSLDSSGLREDVISLLTVSTSCENLPQTLAFFSELPHVLWIEQKHPVFTHNRWARGVCQSGIQSDTPFTLLNMTGQGQIIGISDTGLDMYHYYFYDPNNKTPYNTVNYAHRKVVYYGTQFGDRGDDGTEGHGTHVSGTAAGRSYIDYGDYKRYQGQAPGSKLAFLDISKSDTGALSQPGDIYSQYLKVFYGFGVKIYSNSWGSGASANRYDSAARSVDQFMFDYPDALVIFSAGNDGDKGANTVGSPATNKNGLCVGASLNSYDSFQAYPAEAGVAYSSIFDVNSVASFSSRGPVADGRLKPDVLAPGWWIASSAGRNGSATPFFDLNYLEGTSMSAPAVAGAAAIVRQYFTEGYYPTGRKSGKNGFVPSGALIKAILIHSGQKMEQIVDKLGNTRTVGSYPSWIQGYGRIQLNTVLSFGPSKLKPLSMVVVGAANSSSPYYAALSATGRSHSYVVSVASGTSSLKITLAYTDRPGTPGATKILINDLDLIVTAGTSGVTTLPSPNNANSRIDNIEQITITNPDPTVEYTIQVRANKTTSVQPYALVITGKVVVTNVTAESETSSENFSSRLSSQNQGVIAVLAAVCAILLMVVVCVAIFNRRKSNRDDDAVSIYSAREGSSVVA